MIPKIIHYCWLSNDPFPDNIKACMDSWKKYLPDYELMLWNFDRFDKKSSLWVKQAFEAKKYAFAADYLRLYALYHYGGIYLDTDVEVIKPFDDLLDLPYFLGEENSLSEIAIEAATIGAEKGCFWIGKCLEYYKNRRFVLGIGKYDIRTLPFIIKEIITENYLLTQVNDKKAIHENEREIYILPVDYFSPKKWNDPTIFNLTKSTYSIHHFAGSWKKHKTMKEKSREKISIIEIKIYNKIPQFMRFKIKKYLKKYYV
jgi:mannosyltransferase OCH1-like enzyme